MLVALTLRGMSVTILEVDLALVAIKSALNFETTAQFISLCRTATQFTCFLNEVVAVEVNSYNAHVGYYPALPQKQYYYRQQLEES
jgi:hypothetical protein